MNKMDFYELFKQQYKDYKIEYDALSASCEGCPCESIRHKLINQNERTCCTDEMIYLVDKYKINDANIYLCNECMVAALKIAKKLFGNVNKI